MINENTNPKVKILVGYHKPATLIKNEIFTPIHLGRDLATQASKDGEMSQEDFDWMCENMIGDNTGENISSMNRYLNELTGLYWAWKNYDKLGNPDYIGYSHYRRHFIFKQNTKLPGIDGLEKYFYHFDNVSEAYLDIIDLKHIEDLKNQDIIAPEPYLLENNELKTMTIENDFCKYCENVDILYFLEDLFQKNPKYHEYKNISELFYTNNFYYFCNMFIMKKEIFFKYCSFLFEVIFILLEKFGKRLKETSDPVQKRTLAFVAEHITTFFILKQARECKNINYCKIGFIKNTVDFKLEAELLALKIKKKIDSCKIISFDLFDTLLLRLFEKPDDVFSYLEGSFEANGFKKARVNAEVQARMILGKYPNYDDIYNNIDNQFKFLQEYEKKLEKVIIYVNPFMKEIYEYAKSLNKKIIFTTDMYYDKNFLIQILHSKGIFDFHEVFSSGEIGKSKDNGTLFEYIANMLNSSPCDFLHIGDNFISDYENPKINKWNAVYVKKPLEMFFKYNNTIFSFSQKNNSITSSVIIGMLLKEWIETYNKKSSYWEKIGYTYGGPISYALSNFVYKEACKDDIDEIIFVARDGFVIDKIFNLIQDRFSGKAFKTHYIRAPRVVNILTSLDYDNNFSWDKAGSIIRLYQNQIEDFRNVNLFNMSFSQKKDLIQRNWDKLKGLSQLKLSQYHKYLDGFGIASNKLGLFDISANSFSSMKIFKNYFSSSVNIIGYYWNVSNNSLKNTFKYKAFNELSYFLDHYMISELLITSNEYPVKDISDKKFNFIVNKHEGVRVSIVDQILVSEIKFAKKILDAFGDFKIDLDNSTLIDYLNNFTNNLDFEDRYYLENIYQAVNEDHTKYIKLHFEEKKDMQSYCENNNKKPLGAVLKIKMQLSYKLGYAIVNSKKVSDILKLPFILISIVIAHRYQKKICNFLPLEEYEDYLEAYRVQQHLSYKIGNALIRNPLKFLFTFNKIIKDFNSKKSNK
ncbi:TPA: HAD-IA family hydrolase [Campylobacter lari]|nr:HAD-IA family hydrolase [Campylobacter lari]